MPSAMKPKPKSLKQRIEALEAEMAEVKRRLPPEEPAWKQIVGIFGPEDSKAFDEAMRLGREYRESLRPKPRRTGKKKKATRTRRVGTTK